MKKFSWIAALVLTFGCHHAQALDGKAATNVKKPPPPDYFPLRVDDWWKYKSTTSGGQTSEFTTKVIKAEKQEDGTIIYQVDTITASGQPIHDWYTKPKGLVLRMREKYGDNEAMKVEYQPPYEILKNAPGKDDTWRWAGKGIMSVDVTDSSSVTGPEEVEVPAGKFFAMKVTSDITQGGAKVAKTYWYTNWIGLVKSTTETGGVKNTSELVDYSFKKPQHTQN